MLLELLRLSARSANDFPETIELGLDVFAKLARTARDDFGAIECNTLTHIGQLQRLAQFIVQLRNDVRRRLRRNNHALPWIKHAVLVAELYCSRYVGLIRHALFARLHERAELAGLHISKTAVVEHHRDIAGNQIDQPRRAALIWNRNRL